MLINYSCTNYKSYRCKNVFTFTASKIKQFDEDNISIIDSSLPMHYLNIKNVLRMAI